MHPRCPCFALVASLILTTCTVAPAADALPEGAIARLGTTRFRGEGHAIDSMLSNDGKILATATTDVIQLLDPVSGKEVRRIRKDTSQDSFRTGSLTFSSDGRLLAVSCGSGAMICDVKTGDKVLDRVEVPGSRLVRM